MTDEHRSNKGGRPFNSRSKYRADCPKKAYDILSKGGLLCHVAAGLKVDRQTIAAWRKDKRKIKFGKAIDEGLQLSEAFHADVLARLANGMCRGNVAAQLRIMEFAFGWKNVTTVENVDSVKELTTQEIEEKIARLTDSNVVEFKNKQKTGE